MKVKHVLYLVIIIGMLAPAIAFPVLAEEGDIPMWVHRARLAYVGRSSGGPDAMVAYVHIRDASLDMVEGAAVTIQWTLPDGSTPDEEMLITDSCGVAKFTRWDGEGEYKFCVTDVTKAGWDYDPDLGLNRDTCAVLTSASAPQEPR